MAHDRVRGDHDQLKQIVQLFQQESDAINQTNQGLKSRVETLKGGDWIGKGAKQFYNEMDSAVFPAMGRLQKALAQAAQITKKVSDVLRRAEQEASACLNGSNLRI